MIRQKSKMKILFGSTFGQLFYLDFERSKQQGHYGT